MSLNFTFYHHLAALVVGVHDAKALQDLVFEFCVVFGQHAAVLLAFFKAFNMLLSFEVFVFC